MSTRGVLLASTPAGVEGMWSAASVINVVYMK